MVRKLRHPVTNLFIPSHIFFSPLSLVATLLLVPLVFPATIFCPFPRPRRRYRRSTCDRGSSLFLLLRHLTNSSVERKIRRRTQHECRATMEDRKYEYLCVPCQVERDRGERGEGDALSTLLKSLNPPARLPDGREAAASLVAVVSACPGARKRFQT